MPGTSPTLTRLTRRAADALRFAALVGPLPLAGCLRGALPARELYRLRPLPEVVTIPAGSTTSLAAAAEPLTVEPYATPGVYGAPAIVYRVGQTRYGTYPSREWAVPLGAMLAALTAEQLRQLHGGPGLVRDGHPGARTRGLVWRGPVREFEEVDEGARVAAAVRLDVQLVRAADDSVLWQGAAQTRRPVAPPDAMTAVVDSLSAAAGAAIAELVRGAAPALRAAPAAVARAASGAR